MLSNEAEKQTRSWAKGTCPSVQVNGRKLHIPWK